MSNHWGWADATGKIIETDGAIEPCAEHAAAIGGYVIDLYSLRDCEDSPFQSGEYQCDYAYTDGRQRRWSPLYHKIESVWVGPEHALKHRVRDYDPKET